MPKIAGYRACGAPYAIRVSRAPWDVIFFAQSGSCYVALATTEIMAASALCCAPCARATARGCCGTGLCRCARGVPRALAPPPPGLSRRALIGASFVLLKPRGARALEAITPPPYAEPTGELVTVMRAAVGGDADAAGSFEALGQAWDKVRAARLLRTLRRPREPRPAPPLL